MNAPPLTLETGPAALLHAHAAALLSRRYRARHLPVPSAPAAGAQDEAVTVLARLHERLCGALTLRLDASMLLAEAAYGEEVRQLRARHPRLAELTQLAIDAPGQARLIMAALFDHAWHLLHNRPGQNGALIEVHPRHASFYARRFGFQRVAGPRPCPRAHAPGVLLLLPLPALCALPAPPPRPHVGAARSRREFSLHY